jgi:PAS domain S-box-containing protein
MTESHRSHNRHTILVVDADVSIGESLRTLLCQDGCDVTSASSFREALEVLKGQLPCMLFADVMMSGMDGIELTRRLKQDPRTAHIPVALITARAQEDDVPKGISAGAVDYLTKPFDMQVVRMRVRSHMQLHEAHIERQCLHSHLSVISSVSKDAIVIVDNDGNVLRWNEAAEGILGYTRAEALGNNLQKLLAPRQSTAMPRQPLSLFQPKGEVEVGDKKLELVVISKSGEEVPMVLTLVPVGVDGKWCAVGIVSDIGKHKRMQDVLKQREEEYRLLFETSRDALTTISPPSWKFTSCNQATVAMFGANAEADVTKCGPWDMSPECQTNGRSSREEAQAMIEKAMREGSVSFPWVHKRLDGELFLCDVILTRVEHGGEPFLQATMRDITERVRVQKALQASEARYRASFEDASVGQVLTDKGGCFLEVNAAFAGMLGYGPNELVGKCFCELTHPEDVAKSIGALEDLLRGQRVSRLVKRYLRKDGTTVWVDMNVAALRNPRGEVIQFITSVIDISERMRAEEAAKESSRFLTMLLDAIPVPIYYKDMDGTYRGANIAFAGLLGGEESILGKTAFEIFPLDMAQYDQSKDHELLARQGVQVFETRLRTRLGTVRDVIFHKATFTGPNGFLGGLIGAVLDVTDRKRIESELGHARKLEAVGQLAAGIAHEINTPAQYVGDGVYFLNVAFDAYRQLVAKYRVAVEVLDRGDANANLINEIRELEDEADLDYIEANVPGSFVRCLDGISRISSIVRAMKEFSHPDQREKSPADLNQALQNTLIIAHNEYKYVADVDAEFGDLPPVLCHLGDLNQVFLNLIVNAAHAIGEVVGKEGEKGHIRIRTYQQNDWVCIDIIDTGAGVPESIRDRIFDPFFTTKEVGKGTGQGLAIARSVVVDKHGGTLTFESQVGKGTTFTIRLPIDGGGSGQKVVAP